jgi:phenylacetate-coenzyme A ligase PaaK-like adenylate-forming protein
MNSQVQYQRRRLADMAAALRLARTQTGREHGPRAQLARHQQQRLETVVRHAAAHSPFYRRWFAQTGALGTGPVDLARLPVLDKSLLTSPYSWSTSTSWSVTLVYAVTSSWTGSAS